MTAKMVEGHAHDVPLTVVDGHLVRRDENDRVDDNGIGVHQVAKKIRRTPQENNNCSYIHNKKSSVGSNISSRSPSPPRRWWFSRQQQHSIQETTTSGSRPTTSGMVLSEHLGRTSDVVESLTSEVKNWSLTRLSSPSTSDGTATNYIHTTKKKEKHQRCREAQRQVRMAQRRFIEEQQQHVSPCSFAARQGPAPSLTKE